VKKGWNFATCFYQDKKSGLTWTSFSAFYVKVAWVLSQNQCCILVYRETNFYFCLSDVEHVWNVMAHAQKPDLVFPWNGQVHLNWWGRQFSRLLAAEVCASAVVMVVMLDKPCSEVECKTTGYPLHSHVSPSLPLPCVTVCHQVSTELYTLLSCLLVYKANYFLPLSIWYLPVLLVIVYI